jgi:type II secretory ATPase GspE/PulE/Tfp pilus assembly ATPase PilB-like protein
MKGAWRGGGFTMSWVRILACWIVFLAWIRAAEWVNNDSQEMRLNWLRWNSITVGTFLGAMVLLWLLPWFWFDFPLLLLATIAPTVTYIILRNKSVSAHQQVFTPSHIRFWLSMHLKSFGVKMSAEAMDPNASGVPVKVVGSDKDGATAAGRLLAARQSPGLPTARKILHDALAVRASAIVLDFAATTVAVRYMIDGVWLPQEAMERETADPALEALKLLCGLNPQERRARQEGKFQIEYCVFRADVFKKIDRAEEAFRQKLTIDLTKRMASDEIAPAQLQKEVAAAVEEESREKFATPVGTWTPVDKEKLPKLPGIDTPNLHTSVEPVKCPATLGSQGTSGGERAVIQFETKAIHLATLDDLGMRTKMVEQLKEQVAKPKGFFVVSAPPAGGLRTTTKLVLQSQDRFLRECVTVESEASHYDEIENVHVVTFSEKDPLVPTLTRMFRQEPNVVLLRDGLDSKAMALMCGELADADRMILLTVRAKDSAEALARAMITDAPVPDFAKYVVGAMCQRLVRKLCDKCKEAYAPPPQVLKQLGIPEGRVPSFYRPPQVREDGAKDICRECGGLGYKGQTAIFELLVADDPLRAALGAMTKLDAIRLAARKAGMKTLQEEGILLVARGVTSLPELVRVMKEQAKAEG